MVIPYGEWVDVENGVCYRSRKGEDICFISTEELKEAKAVSNKAILRLAHSRICGPQCEHLLPYGLQE